MTWPILPASFSMLSLSSSLKGGSHPLHFICCQLITPTCFRDERQVSHQQRGLHTPWWEDARRRTGEAENQEEDSLPRHWWSGRLHNIHLPLRSEDKCLYILSLPLFLMFLLCCLDLESHNCTSPWILPLIFPLMSLFTFPLPIQRHANQFTAGQRVNLF